MVYRIFFTSLLLAFSLSSVCILAATQCDVSTYSRVECGDNYCAPRNNNSTNSCYANDPCCYPACCNSDYDVLFSVEYLYWKINSDELPYAWNVDAAEVELQAAKVERIEPDAESGVRVGLSAKLPCCNSCYLSAEWTHLCGSSTESATEETFLIPIWLSTVGNPLADTADAEYKIKLNIADISLVRPICSWNKNIFLTSIGVRGVWLDQDLDVEYRGGNISAGLDAKNSIEFCGWGLRAGALTQCEICNGFSFVGWSYVDLLWSKIDVFQKGVRDSNDEVRGSIEDSIHTTTPMFELFLGLSWECKLSCAQVKTRIGWEQQYFINGVQLNQYCSRNDDDISIHQHGGLGFGGLTVGLAVGF